MRQNLVTIRGGLIAALDMGCSKVCCFIARAESGERPRVIGIGQQASRGLKAGAVVDMDAVEGTIRNAVHAAEQMAGETIDRVTVNLSCGHPASASAGVEVTLNGHPVGDADLRRVFAAGPLVEAANGSDQDGRRLIHAIPTGYRIDGSRGIHDPRGMVGRQLGVDMHYITADSGPVRNLTTCVRRCHLEVGGYVVSPYASGLAALVEDELNLGATVIDMGGGTTTIAIFYEGNVVFASVVPVGGVHVTNDIARGLSTSLAQAERMKTLFGHAVATGADEFDSIDAPRVGEDAKGGARQVPRSQLIEIIQPRLEETFELVRSDLEASGLMKVAGRGVVLTGGACQLAGAAELAGLILDKQVRIGRPVRVDGLAESTAGPAYATCAGLLIRSVYEDLPAGRIPPPRKGVPDGPVGRFGRWIREHV